MKKTYKEQEEEKKELNLERKKLKKQLKKIEDSPRTLVTLVMS